MAEISQTELAYIAGFFDGEGTVGVYETNKNKYARWTLKVNIAQVNPIPIIRIKKLYGGNIFLRKARGKSRQYWSWTASARKAERFLKSITGYLIIKKDEVSLALAFMDLTGKQGKPVLEHDYSKKRDISTQIKLLKKQEWATLPM